MGPRLICVEAITLSLFLSGMGIPASRKTRCHTATRGLWRVCTLPVRMHVHRCQPKESRVRPQPSQVSATLTTANPKRHDMAHGNMGDVMRKAFFIGDSIKPSSCTRSRTRPKPGLIGSPKTGYEHLKEVMFSSVRSHTLPSFPVHSGLRIMRVFRRRFISM